MPPNDSVPPRSVGDYTPGSPIRLCKVENCDKPMKARGFCAAHYQRDYTHGDVFAHVPVGMSWQLQWQTEPDEMAVERATSGDPPDVLLVSERHLAIARLTERGLTATQIAQRLRCTPRTVVRHRTRLRLAEKSFADSGGSVSAFYYTENVPQRAAS